MMPEHILMSAIKSYLLKEFLPGEDPSMLTPTTALVSSGVLDSLAMLRLVNFLEQEFGVRIEAYEADEEHFETLQAICEMIEGKGAGARSARVS
jgi:acyl carrier protein